MPNTGVGWIYTRRTDDVQDVCTSSFFKRPIYSKKVQNLPPLNIHYDTPPSSNDKRWTDQSLVSTESVNNYLADADAYQRASFEHIIEKWKQYDTNKTNNLMLSFDSRYNMKTRFRQDDKLNRAAEMSCASGAKYYRFRGNENNPKNDKPCGRHQRRLQEYDERHFRELLKLPTTTKIRSTPYWLPQITKLPPIETDIQSSQTTRSSVSVAEDSHHTVS